MCVALEEDVGDFFVGVWEAVEFAWFCGETEVCPEVGEEGAADFAGHAHESAAFVWFACFWVVLEVLVFVFVVAAEVDLADGFWWGAAEGVAEHGDF